MYKVLHGSLVMSNSPLSGCSLVYSFTCWGISWLFPVLAIMNESCYRHPCASFCVDISFQFIWVKTPRSSDAGSYGKCVLSFVRSCNCLWRWLYTVVHSHHQWMISCSTISLAFCVVSDLGFGHSDRCIVNYFSCVYIYMYILTYIYIYTHIHIYVYIYSLYILYIFLKYI